MAGAVFSGALRSVGAVGKQMMDENGLHVGAETALRSAPGLTVQGAAAFLATCAQESAYFRTTQEYGTNLRYDPYRGRTFIQLTGRGNYASFGQWLKNRSLIDDADAFVKNPQALADPQWAWLGPMFYFEVNNIWKWANPGLFLAVSQAVNGGVGRVGTSFVPNGWKERQAMYAAFLGAGNALLPGSPAVLPSEGWQKLPDLRKGMNNPSVASLQRFCNLFDWKPALPLLPVTGLYGDQTVNVLRLAALQMGIKGADGENVGPQYKQSLWQRGWRG